MKILKKMCHIVLKIPIHGVIGKIFNYSFPVLYSRYTYKYLKFLGINFTGVPNFIAGDVDFDSSNYSLITIGKGTVISKGVMLLTHDFSIARGLQAAGIDYTTWGGIPHFLKTIEIGDNCFIGARTIILPGTSIGDNSIIGAGSVIKGTFGENNIICGNPAKIFKKTDEWALKKYQEKDYIL